MSTDTQFSRVFHMDTLNEVTFSLPPLEALVAAFEQSRGNNNTWNYGLPEDYPIRRTKYGAFLGGFWVRTQTNTTT